MKTRLPGAALLCALAASACSAEPEPKAAPAAPAAAAPASAAAAPLDICALLSRSDAETLIGVLAAEPQPGAPQGSLLGECNYQGADAPLNLSARPAQEFKGTVKFAGKKAAVQPVAGLGEQAVQTQYGLMIQPAGKDYFLVVLVLKSGKHDDALSVGIARKLKL